MSIETPRMSGQDDWWGASSVQGCSVKTGRDTHFVECTDIKKNEESGKNVIREQDQSSETNPEEKGIV